MSTINNKYTLINDNYQIDKQLYQLIINEILPNTNIDEKLFFNTLVNVLNKYCDLNQSLLKTRDSIQSEIDSYLLKNKNQEWDEAKYISFLTRIGYLVDKTEDFQVETINVDDEIACTPAPQLVVPVDNARYALNAANARWGSLMDAFYGTDAGPPETNGQQKGGAYNPKRGAAVFEYAHQFLNQYFKLSNNGKFEDIKEFDLEQNGKSKRLICKLDNGDRVSLDVQSKFVGYNLNSSTNKLSSILLKNNNLHVEIQIDRNNNIGKTHKAGIKDIILEAAVTAIADCEDSVASVDAEDKCKVYSNWNGLMTGNLKESLNKGGKTVERKLRLDKEFISPNSNEKFFLPGRATLLVRNVGIHKYTDAILTPMSNGSREVPEGIMDAVVTIAAALHDLLPKSITNKDERLLNSRKKSMYLVKPKMHGPDEVRYTCDLLTTIEKAFNIPKNTVKIGIMDEERRTTVNLHECIRQAKDRVIFINTGFLDRTGDEIHTSYHAGPVTTKADIKKATWRTAYEDWNVDVGLIHGLKGVAQIGKGMWAAPSAMNEMVKQKIGHPKSGATTA